MVLRSTEQLGGEDGPLSSLSMLTPHQHTTSNSRVTECKMKIKIRHSYFNKVVIIFNTKSDRILCTRAKTCNT